MLLIVTTESVASITYSITPREGKLENWSLDGGTITTDGTLGEISSSNFESWEFNFTSPAGDSTISSSAGEVLEVLTQFQVLDGVGDPIDFSSNTDLEQPSTTTLFATPEQLSFQIGGNDIYELFFYSTDLVGYFSGKMVSFFPQGADTGEGIRFVGDSTSFGPGAIIDNDVDSTDILNPFDSSGASYFEEHANLSRLQDTENPEDILLVGKAILVPEPLGSYLVLLGCLSFSLRGRRNVSSTRNAS